MASSSERTGARRALTFRFCGRAEHNPRGNWDWAGGIQGEQNRRIDMIRKLKSGEFRIYSRHQDPKTGRRKNLGTFATREKAEEHERAIQYFKRH